MTSNSYCLTASWGSCGNEGYTKLEVWLIRLGVNVSHSRVCHPQTLGKDERFHRTLKAEVLSQHILTDLGQCQYRFDLWRDIYNLELVPDLIEYERVILVDAGLSGESIAVRTCNPSLALPSSTDHNVSPEVLQQLALELYDVPIDIHLYTVRGECFDFGSTFSPAMKDRANYALAMIISRIQSPITLPEQSQFERG